jgi:hypothetical protein
VFPLVVVAIIFSSLGDVSYWMVGLLQGREV